MQLPSVHDPAIRDHYKSGASAVHHSNYRVRRIRHLSGELAPADRPGVRRRTISQECPRSPVYRHHGRVIGAELVSLFPHFAAGRTRLNAVGGETMTFCVEDDAPPLHRTADRPPDHRRSTAGLITTPISQSGAGKTGDNYVSNQLLKRSQTDDR